MYATVEVRICEMESQTFSISPGQFFQEEHVFGSSYRPSPLRHTAYQDLDYFFEDGLLTN